MTPLRRLMQLVLKWRLKGYAPFDVEEYNRRTDEIARQVGGTYRHLWGEDLDREAQARTPQEPLDEKRLLLRALIRRGVTPESVAESNRRAADAANQVILQKRGNLNLAQGRVLTLEELNRRRQAYIEKRSSPKQS